MADEPVPLNPEEIKKLIQEQITLQQGYLRFAQDQAKEDRANFDRMFKRTVQFIGIVSLVVVGAATFFGMNTISQIREQAREAGKAELVNVRLEVRKRIEDEFRTDQIQKLVREVAADRTKQELQSVIRSETTAQVSNAIQQQAPTIKKAVEEQTKQAVRDLEPTINAVVKKETEKKIDESVKPIQRELAAYGEMIAIGTLATLAKANDRKAFDKLVAIATNPKAPEDRRNIAITTASAIIVEKANAIRLGREFREKQTPESMKRLMTTNPDVFMRLTAVDKYPAEDQSVLPTLVEVINTDTDLEVVSTAIKSFNSRTGQSFELPNYAALNDWWVKNKGKFTSK